MNKIINVSILNTLKAQAQAEAPRLLLATLALLIVGLMMNPTDVKLENTQEVAIETPTKAKPSLKVSVANLKNQR